jgi:hypothetical protein
MKLPLWTTTVTPFSKILAMILFILFPIFGFFFGIKYQILIDNTAQLNKSPFVTFKPSPTLDPSSQELSNISSWQTHMSPNGYSIKYPSSFKPVPSPRTNDVIEFSLDNGIMEIVFWKPFIIPNQFATIEQWRDEPKGLGGWPIYERRVTVNKIKGNEVYLYEGYIDTMPMINEYFPLSNRKYFEIRARFKNEKMSDLRYLKSIYYKIISTISFSL